jgi:hypothetical protein
MRETFGRANLGFALFTLIALGCVTLQPYDPGPGRRVAVSVAQDAYVSGESVNITIANLSDVELSYPGGFCKTKLQRMDGTAWTTIPSPSAGCPIRLGFLDPRQAVVHQFSVPRSVGVGTYRLAMPMPVPEGATVREPELLSPPFKVQSSSAQ